MNIYSDIDILPNWRFTGYQTHRVIILNRGSMPRNWTGRKWCKFSLPECATSQRDALETACSLANGPSWGRGGGAGSSPGIAASPISFVYGRSLWVDLNNVENSLHWNANMLPLFSIMTVIKPASRVIILFVFIIFAVYKEP